MNATPITIGILAGIVLIGAGIYSCRRGALQVQSLGDILARRRQRLTQVYSWGDGEDPVVRE